MSKQKIYYTIIPTQVYDSPNTDAAPAGEFDTDTELQVLESNLGSKSDLSKVKLVTGPGPEYYVRTYFLFTKPDEAYDLFLVPSYQDIELSNPKETKIKDAKVGVPYLENGKYHIVIDTGLTNTEEVQNNLSILKYQAVEDILEYYGKVATSDLSKKIADSTNNVVEVSDFHYSVRPGQNIKIRFSISVKYLRVFPDQNMDDFALENIHKNFISINIRVDELDQTVNSLSNIILDYNKQLAGFSGEIEGLNFKKMSKDIRKFLTDFKKFLRENHVTVSNTNSNKLEIGFDAETFELSYVLYYDPYGKFLRIGTNIFCKLVNVKIAKMLINYKNILSSSTAGLSWMDFCNNFFTGEYKVNFNKISQLGSTAKKSLSNLEDKMDNLKADFEDMSIMVPIDVSGLSLLRDDDNFRETASELLLRSKDAVGDNFLVDLPNVLANVEDLQSLYTLVFDKVSIKDLVDVMMENIGKNMNLPDLNEIKIRGILKKISLEELPKICMEMINLPEFKFEDLAEMILDDYEFSIEEFEAFLEIFGDLIEDFGIEPYFIHKTSTGEFAGLLIECFENLGEELSLEIALEPNGISVDYSNLNLLEYYQPSSVSCMLKKILTNVDGIPDFDIMFKGVPESLQSYSLSELIPYAFDFFEKLDKSQLSIGLEKYIKELFKNSLNPSELVSSLLSIPKIKVELDKINLTKDKFLDKVPGLNLDLEKRKIDANFSMPSIKSVNPSFDFSKFQFDNMGDIFGSAVTAIEDSIVSGIETGLVATFKTMLGGVLDSISNNTPDIDNPDFGALNLNDIMDATNGFGSDMLAKLASAKVNFAIELGNSKTKKDCDEEIPSEPLTTEQVKASFDDMSRALKPMELTRILKGQYNSRDYENMTAAIEDEGLKNLMSEDLFNEVIDIAVDYVDLNLLEELEKAYDTEEVMVSVCENSGIPYRRRGIRDDLKNKYEDLDDRQLDNLIDSIVEDVKDSMADAIGNMKDNFQDNLPFDENPCSFMPKPSDIPAMNFIDDMTFDTIFDPIELEYKSEATTVPDLLMNPTDSDEYVQLFYYGIDSIPDGYDEDEETGLPIPKFKRADEMDNWDEISNNGRIYNEAFGNHYIGRGTKLYYLESNTFIPVPNGEIKLVKTEEDQWDISTDSVDNETAQVYIRKQDQVLTPLPNLRNFLLNPNFNLTYKNKSLDFRLAYNGLKDRRFELRLGHAKNQYKKVTIDPKNVDIECAEFFDVVESADRGDGFGILTTVNEFILEQFDKSGLASGFKQNLVNILEDNFTSNSTPQTIVDSNKHPGRGLDKRSIPVAMNIVGSVFEQMASLISTTDLFNTSNMLAFVIDNEDVNLLKVQDSKNDAKDGYKDKCSFTEDDNELQNSSIKKLLYLMIRMFVIEEVVRGCFVYDVFYDKEASDSYCSQMYASITSELENYPSSFFEDTFKVKYQEAYGKPFADNKLFKDMVKEIYSDISDSFEKLFQNAEDSLIKAFLKSCVQAPNNIDRNRTIPTIIKKSSIDYFDNNDKYILDDTVNKIRTRFIIQKSIRQEDGTETPIGDAGAVSQDVDLVTKLCFVMEITDPITGWFIDPIYHPLQYETVSINNSVFPNSPAQLQRLKKSTSYNVRIISETGSSRIFLILPVAIEVEKVSRFGSLDTDIWELPTFVEFINEICRGATMKEFLINSIQARMLIEKPEISSMFIDTKTSIRKAIESLSNDSYDRQEQETKMVQLDQASEASTNPDFSPKAAKMALMTVPMIIKGFAEMFDPNTKIASAIRKGFDMSGIDIPPPVASLMALPVNIIPIAPGPPITPLGLLYLATSFLEPKERKKLSDLKRGKNLNKGANQETGTFEEGTLEEQARAQTLESIETARDIVKRYEKIKVVMYKMCRFIVDEMNELHHAGDKKIGVGFFDPTGLVLNTDVYASLDLKIRNFIPLESAGIAPNSREYYTAFHLTDSQQDDSYDEYFAGVQINNVVTHANQVQPFVEGDYKYSMPNQSAPTDKSDPIEDMIAFIINFWIMNANSFSSAGFYGLETHSNSLIYALCEVCDKAITTQDYNGNSSIDSIFSNAGLNLGKDFRKLIQQLALSMQRLRAGMMYTIYAIEKLLGDEFEHGVAENYAFNKSNLVPPGDDPLIYKSLFDPTNNDVVAEFNRFVEISEEFFRDSSNYSARHEFSSNESGLTNYNIQLKNIRDNIFAASKFRNLFKIDSSSTPFMEIFGNDKIKDGLNTYVQNNGVRGSEIAPSISQNLQDFEEEYERAKEALERFEE